MSDELLRSFNSVVLTDTEIAILSDFVAVNDISLVGISRDQDGIAWASGVLVPIYRLSPLREGEKETA